jgi:hypothetical protein
VQLKKIQKRTKDNSKNIKFKIITLKSSNGT